MYDKLFSPQWIFDRCVEGNYLFIPLNILVNIILVIGLYLLFRHLTFGKKLRLTLTIGSVFALIPLVFIGSMLFGFTNCSDAAFWQGVRPANNLYTKVKYECKNGNCPKSEDELATFDPRLYQQMITNAKSKYMYDATKNQYTWYVRPSLYYMVSFEGNGFGVYKIPQFLPVDHWNHSIVPDFNGSKDELPK